MTREGGLDHGVDDLRAHVRDAAPSDVAAILDLVRELAAYERSPESAVASESDLAAALFGTVPAAHALVADVDGFVVGVAVWYSTFSTWTGRRGVHLEDLYVRPAHRRSGFGRALLAELAARCVAGGWPRLEWAVLDWNSPAVAFYRSVGAESLGDWTTYRLSGTALLNLGAVPEPQDE